MMWFVIVPPWLFFTVMAATAVFGVLELIEDADCRADQRSRIYNQRTPKDFKLSEPGSCPEFQHLLKRLAATRKVQS